VLWLLLVLYGLAAGQGLADARRDAVDDTSTLPVIAIAMAGKDAVIGRDPDQLLINPNGVRLFGSRERYDALLGAELNPVGGGRRWRPPLAAAQRCRRPAAGVPQHSGS